MSASSSLKILISTTTFSLLLSYDVPRQKKMDRNEGKSLSVFQAIKWRNVCTYHLLSSIYTGQSNMFIQHLSQYCQEFSIFWNTLSHNRASSEKDFLEGEQIQIKYSSSMYVTEGQIALQTNDMQLYYFTAHLELFTLEIFPTISHFGKVQQPLSLFQTMGWLQTGHFRKEQERDRSITIIAS